MAPSQKIAAFSSSASSTMLGQAVIGARSAELPKSAIIGLISMGSILGWILVSVYLYHCLRCRPLFQAPGVPIVDSGPTELDSHVSPQDVWAASQREAELLATSRQPQKSLQPVDSSTIPCTTEGCTQRFASPSDLNHHMRYHNRPHQCQSCELCFGTITHLRRHINDVHNTTEKYHCPKPSCKYSIYGGKSFSRKDNLKRHMGTHTESESFGSTAHNSEG